MEPLTGALRVAGMLVERSVETGTTFCRSKTPARGREATLLPLGMMLEPRISF